MVIESVDLIDTSIDIFFIARVHSSEAKDLSDRINAEESISGRYLEVEVRNPTGCGHDEQHGQRGSKAQRGGQEDQQREHAIEGGHGVQVLTRVHHTRVKRR